LVLAMGILWNPEFGTLTYAAFVVFLLAVELLGADRRRILRGMVSILSSAALCAIAVLSSYALAIRVAYGSFPELFKMFRTFRVFSELGFNMLPMPLIHPWNLIALVFILGLASFLVAVIGRTLTPRHALILLVTIHGIGAFMYYQGRSHNWTLLGATTYAFILMAFFAESLRSAARDEGWYFLPWALIVFVLAGSVCQLTYAAPAISALVTEDANKVGSSGENMTIADNARFIRAHTQENEKVLILSRNYHQAYYYGFSHTVAAINPGLLDLFWREDYNRIVRFLASNKDVKIFFDPQGFARYNDMVDTVLSGMYEARSNNGRLWLLQKK
ncbi:MAG TPA: hypothetical protein VI389_02750, partial [Geobacteraceae bacterium]